MKNLFVVDSVCDEMVSSYAQQVMKSFLRLLSPRMLHIIFENYPKNQIKMQFFTKNNQNFEKSSRILSNRRTYYQKNCFDTSQQKIGSACAQSPRKC